MNCASEKIAFQTHIFDSSPRNFWKANYWLKLGELCFKAVPEYMLAEKKAETPRNLIVINWQINTV